MKTHKRHKFVKEYVEVRETESRNRYEKVALRKVFAYKCRCSAEQLFYRMPYDDDLIMNFYYSDPILQSRGA